MATVSTGLATSFITFSRPGASGGGATVTDRDGKIKWAGHNLLTNSEAFDASSWLKNGVTVTANATAAPSGQSTADAVFETSASGYHLAYWSLFTFLAASYTLAVYVKANGRTRFALTPDSTTVFAADAKFDLSAVTATATSGSASIENIGNGWYRVSITGVSTAGATNLNLAILDSAGNLTYTGDITKGVYLWGAHLYRSDMQMQLNPAMPAGMQSYYPTTVRNALGWTEDFSNAAWARDNTTITANVINAPNGLKTADLLTSDATSGAHQISQGLTGIANTPLSLSVYVKAGTSSYVFLRLTGTAGTDNWTTAVFDLSSTSTTASQTATGSSSGTILAYSKTNVGDGWWRLSLIGYINRTDPYYTIGFAAAATGNTFTTSGRPSNFAGTTSDTFYLWGAQLSDSASLDTYVPVYGAAVTSAAYYAPRLDFDGATLAAKGLLVEEARTNVVLHSSDFSNAVWNASSFRTLQVTTDQTTAPDGTSTADKVVEAAAGAGSVIQRVIFSDTSASAQKVVSVYAKKSERKRIYLFVNGPDAGGWFDLDLGTSGAGTDYPGGTTSITPVGNGWYRCSLTPGGASGSNLVQICVITDTATTSDTRVGDGTSGVFFWGAQLEAGSFSTSYIPTGSATATRAADVASVSTQAFPFTITEGSIVVAFDTFDKDDFAPLYLGTTTTGSPNIFYFGSNFTGAIHGYAATVITNNAATFPTSNVVKAAYGFSSGSSNFTVNGTNSANNTQAITVANNSPMYLGSRGTDFFLNGHIRQITYLPRRISNAELQSRTQ